jgi:hypothetical protein
MRVDFLPTRSTETWKNGVSKMLKGFIVGHLECKCYTFIRLNMQVRFLPIVVFLATAPGEV